MARYCFYCGRELAAGEKCDCRHHQTSQSAQPDKQAAAEKDDNHDSESQKQPRQSAAGKTAGTGSFKRQRPAASASSFASALRFLRALNPFRSAAGTNRAKSSQQRYSGRTAPTGRSPGQSKAGPSSRLDAAHAGRAFARYLTQPADQIRLTAESSAQRPYLGMLLIQAVMAGLILVLATEQPHLGTVLGLNIASAQQGGSLVSRLFLITQGAGISITSYLLQTLLYQLLLRYIFRNAISYLRLLKGLSASCFYSSLFLLSGVLLMSGSFFGTLLVVTAAYAVSLMAQALALRHIAGLDENQVMVLIAISALIFCSIIALFFNLSLPVLDALLEQSIII